MDRQLDSFALIQIKDYFDIFVQLLSEIGCDGRRGCEGQNVWIDREPINTSITHSLTHSDIEFSLHQGIQDSLGLDQTQLLPPDS